MQLAPPYPYLQLHRNPLNSSMHSPPLRQGLPWQMCAITKRNTLKYQGKHPTTLKYLGKHPTATEALKGDLKIEIF